LKKVFEISINALVGLAAVMMVYQVVAQRRASSPARRVTAGDHLPNIGGVAWGRASLLLCSQCGRAATSVKIACLSTGGLSRCETSVR
jgi:hypothetical protein